MSRQSENIYRGDDIANRFRSGGYSKKLAQCCILVLSCLQILSLLVLGDANRTSLPQIDPDLASSFFAEYYRNELPHELPEQIADRNPSGEIFLKTVDYYMNRFDEMHGVYSLRDLALIGYVGRAQGAIYLDIYTHHYDNPADMRRALGPGVDNEACVKQLENLVQRTRRQEIEKYRSKDLNLFQLFDTWGRVPAGVLLGYGFFEGAYNECLRLKIKVSSSHKDQPSGGSVQTRYCVLTTKHKDWPRLDKHDLYNMKMGICIPKTCDSSNYKNKYDLIMRLAQNTLRPFEVGEIKFNGLYCLPDEDSPMRSILHNPKSLIALVALSLWLLILLFATWKHHQLSTTTSQQESTLSHTGSGGKLFGMTNMQIGRRRSSVASEDSVNYQNNKPNRQGHSINAIKIYELLSITNNLERLFNTTKASSLLSTDESPRQEQEGTSMTNDNNDDRQDHYQHNTATLLGQPTTEGGIKSFRVDLRCIEGIKVITAVYIIIGHTMMTFSTAITNPKEVIDKTSVSYFLVNTIGALVANAFFAITGMLTCYLIFKQQQTYSFITSPGKWLAFIVYRYLRIMPMYAIVVLYCKYLAKFINSGPLWDYGTSSLGQRKICEQESWWWTLTFTANFLRPFQHCIPSAWYLPNDFQFFLVTPFYLAVLFKRPLIGRCIILASIVASIVANFYNIYGSDVDDLRPVASFEPHGFKTYVSHFSSNYSYPQYRIPAYLFGLLIGHQLYLFEVAANSRSSAKANHSSNWSAVFQRYATTFSALVFVVIVLTPIIGSMLPFTKWSAKLGVALMTPIYHLLYALATGIYLYMATTGRGNKRLDKFLSAPQWKPLARLSLCVVLVNIETINFIIQGSSNLFPITRSSHLALNCLTILSTYLVATALCVLFEAPIRGALNVILTLFIKKAAAVSKKSRPKCIGSNKEKIF